MSCSGITLCVTYGVVVVYKSRSMLFSEDDGESREGWLGCCGSSSSL